METGTAWSVRTCSNSRRIRCQQRLTIRKLLRGNVLLLRLEDPMLETTAAFMLVRVKGRDVPDVKLEMPNGKEHGASSQVDSTR